MTIRVHPSQLGFAYEACPRCLWLHFRKVSPARGGYEQFNLLDRIQQDALSAGTSLRELGVPGEVAVRSDWAVSRTYGEGETTFQIFGKYDLLARLDAGGLAVVDLKTSKPHPDKVSRYRKQIGAYVLALTEPERFEPLDVRGGYLLHWWAERGTFVAEAQPPALVADFRGHAVEVPLDLADVRESMETVAAIASLPRVPDAHDDCPNCGYVRRYGEAVRSSREAARREDPQAVGA